MAKPKKKVNELPEPREVLEQLGQQSAELDQTTQEWVDYLTDLRTEIENHLNHMNRDESVAEEYIDHE